MRIVLNTKDMNFKKPKTKIIKCAMCSVDTVAKTSGKRFCSQKCADKFRYGPCKVIIPKPTKVCLFCKKEFLVSKWRVGKAKYCSYECLGKSKETDRSYRKERKCDGCGRMFLPTQWYQKFCKRICF